jgi:hypothetical protein
MTKSKGIRPRRGSVIAHFRENLYVVTSACKVWPYARAGQYGVVSVDTRQFYVHHLACLAWNGPPPPGKEAGHGPCHNPLCWNGGHVSWRSPEEQYLDKLRDGTHGMGSRNPQATLTDEMVYAIRRSPPTSQKVVARQFGISQPTVSNIITGKTWRHLK